MWNKQTVKQFAVNTVINTARLIVLKVIQSQGLKETITDRVIKYY